MNISVLFWLFTSAIDPQAESLSLRDAVDQALDRNPAVAISKQQLRASESNLKLAMGKATPEISGSMSYARLKDAVKSTRPRFDGDPFNSYNSEISLTQPIFQRGFFNGIFSADRDKMMKHIDLQITQRDLTIDVMAGYFKVLLNSRDLEHLKRAKTVREQSLETARRRSRIGRAQTLDVLQIQTQLALIEPKIQKAENDLSSSRSELAILLGDQTRKSFNLTNAVATGKFDSNVVKALIKQTSEMSGADPLSAVPELKRFQLEREKSELDLTVRLGKYWPTLTADASAGRGGYKKSDVMDNDATNWRFGVTLSVPIFHGLSYFFESQSIDAEYQQLKSKEIQTRDRVAKDQAVSREDLETSLAMIDSSDKALDLAEKSLKVAHQEYRVSGIDYLQLLNTEQSLLEAEEALDQARYDAILKLANYFKAYGYPFELLVERLN